MTYIKVLKIGTIIIYWKLLVVQGTFLSSLSSLVFAFHTILPSSLETDTDAQIALCQFTKAVKPTLVTDAICGYKGEACSIAVYKHQSEAHVQKDVECDCLEQVFPKIDGVYQNIAGKLL